MNDGMKSIALPAIGAGKWNMQPKSVEEILTEFVKNHQGNSIDVRLVLIDKVIKLNNTILHCKIINVSIHA